ADVAACAASQDSWELLLCHCASGKGSEYRMCAAVRRECLRRRQFAFIRPPASLLFYKLPCLFLFSGHRCSGSFGAAWFFILSRESGLSGRASPAALPSSSAGRRLLAIVERPLVCGEGRPCGVSRHRLRHFLGLAVHG